MKCPLAPALGFAATILAAALLTPVAAYAQDLVAKTEALTPAQEQKTFKLPPGFEIQLVAAEPDIKKPMNIAFDAKGRLWVTETVEYPYPAPEGRTPRDGVKILEDFGPDGRARKITEFATGLNIPIGILPIENGGKNAALVYAIPHIYRMADDDGDGKADGREIVLGVYGSKDTHGMTNHFTVGFDGWVYANHGFSNTSTVRAKGGSEITMNSGNTYRFKADGSRVEYFAHGQVNPFGLAFDPMGNLYSADCHTFPQYLLLRGAYYPSFGKPHDGLGFGPQMVNHLHGSTGIAGTVYYAAEHFPPEYRGNLFNGNPVTNRINRDTIEWHGSSPKGIEQPDFLVSDDPWFRPVDLQLGPDGALYVADFYNRIIGHYEVPLEHPGRDRERGRIWRIVYRGADGKDQAPSVTDLSMATPEHLVELLAHLNLALRMMAANQLVDRIGPAAIGLVKPAVTTSVNVWQKSHGLWVLHRLGALPPELLIEAAKDDRPTVRGHVMRILAETPQLSQEMRVLAIAALEDLFGHVKRDAADALGRHPDVRNIRPLLDLRVKVPAEDTHLLHAVRMALRDQLQAEGVASKLPLPGWSEADERAIADVALGATSPDIGAFLVRHVKKYDYPPDRTADFLRHAARYLPAGEVDALSALVNEKFPDDLDLQLALYRSIREGLAQRGAAMGAGVRTWAAKLAGRLLDSLDPRADQWSHLPAEGRGADQRAWVTQVRASADGDERAVFWSSLPLGETRAGALRSPPFAVPERLSFYAAGHNGPPGAAKRSDNMIRLRDAQTGEVLAESPPPRNDVARKVEWDLKKHVGRRAYVEGVDADTGTGYAWLAFGRFDPPVVPMPKLSAESTLLRQQTAAEIARELKLVEHQEWLAALLASGADPQARAAAARALAAISPDAQLKALGQVAADPEVPPALRDAVAQALVEIDTPAARDELLAGLAAAPHRLQRSLAVALAGHPKGAEALLEAVEKGKASPRLLTEPQVRDRLNAAAPRDLDRRVAQLTKGMVDASEEVQKLMDGRRAAFAAALASDARPSAERGAKVFTTHCAACHRVGNEGATVGPQLDGVGKRGVDRILEDVLDPSRNVDAAFRQHVYQLRNGQTVAGLLRRTEGELVVVADSTGKEVSFPESQVRRSAVSGLSLMPGNFGEVIPPGDFNDLIAFLLSK